MITLNSVIGNNPLHHHRPQIVYKFSQFPFYFTVGQGGQIIAWNPQYQPIYTMLASINADTNKLIAMQMGPIRLISQQERTYKIITIHSDFRVRIWQANDGRCINISAHGIFNENILGIAQIKIQSRFLIFYSLHQLQIFDVWSMSIIGTFEPKKDTYSSIQKVQISKSSELQLMDSQKKWYRMNFHKLFNQSVLDVGKHINNSRQMYEQFKSFINELKQEKIEICFKKVEVQVLEEQLIKIKQTIQRIKQQEKLSKELFNQCTLLEYPELSYIFDDEEPSVSNLYFIKSDELWYYVGFQSGKLFGIPCFKLTEQKLTLLQQKSFKSRVQFIEIMDSLMYVSWQNGTFAVYSNDNQKYTIQTEIKRQKQIEENKCNEKQTNIILIPMNKLRKFTCKLSSSIKYKLELYNINNKTKPSQIISYQLYNHQVIIYNKITSEIKHYRGINLDYKIYIILQIEQYIGIVHDHGIDVFNLNCYQRTISYRNWLWQDYELFDKINWCVDVNNFQYKLQNGIDLFAFNYRANTQKIDYYHPQSNLLYQTVGIIQDDQLNNHMYPIFHFIHKYYTEKILHNSCMDNSTIILKIKLDNIKKDQWNNTCFILHGNLNRQLQSFVANDTEDTLNKIQNNFVFYNLFLWQQLKLPYLTQLFKSTNLSFILNKRLAYQGIGKTFTLQYNNSNKLKISKEILTYQALASISFFQANLLQHIELTDQIVDVVKLFTAGGNGTYFSNGQLLAQMTLSSNQNISKASLNLLIATVIADQINLHPLYEYFHLNLKQYSNRHLLLSETQTFWLVYLGIGVIYGKQLISSKQITILINRIISVIQLINFEHKNNLILIILRIFNQGIFQWKQLIQSIKILKLLSDLFKIFFYYDAIPNINIDDKKFNFCFLNININRIKFIKNNIIRTIVYISKSFQTEFLQVLRNQATNQKIHLYYPSSVVEILRQYIKSQRPSSHLVFYVELLLQCLSPMTPQLRKYVQKNVLNTLQIMCTYKFISFNQPSQKLSVRTQNHVYIYCLRTSTKWRTINIKDSKADNNSILEMSPKGTYIALLSEKLYIWRLSSGFWNGVLGAFSQGWIFQAKGHELYWEQNEQSVTVINENCSLNKNFKL